MKTIYFFTSFCLLLVANVTLAQNASIKGVILDEFNQPIEGVNISSNGNGTQSNENGFYNLDVAANETFNITFSHISHKNVSANFLLEPGEQFEFNPVMKVDIEQISTVTINGKKRKDVEGIVTIAPALLRKIPGANAGAGGELDIPPLHATGRGPGVPQAATGIRLALFAGAWRQ